MLPRQIFELILLAALWGGSFMFLRMAAPEFGPVALIQLRVIIAAAVLLPLWFIRSTPKQKADLKPNIGHLLIVGVLNSAAPFVLFAYSTLHITGGFSSILNSTAPIWTAVVAWFWLSQKPNSSVLTGLILGLVGVVVLVSNSISWQLSGASAGIVAALAATLMYGIAANYTAEKLRGVHSLTIATFSLVSAAILLLPVSYFYLPTNSISTSAWMAVIVMGLFCTAAANILYFKLLSEIGSTKAITVTFLIPVFGTLWGALFLGELVTTQMAIGGLIILTGTALVTGVVSLRRQQYSN